VGDLREEDYLVDPDVGRGKIVLEDFQEMGWEKHGLGCFGSE
jgi:hypothetical protein